MRKSVLLCLTALFTLAGCNSGDPSGLPMKRADAVKKVKALGKDSGFMIDYSYQDDTGLYDLVAGMLGNEYWLYRSDRSGVALKLDDEACHAFAVSENKYVYAASYEKEQFDNFFSSNVLFKAYNMDGVKYSKSESVTIANRTCTYYTFTYEVLSGHAFDYRIAIDDEYGIALALEATSAGATAENSVAMRAKAFQIGGEIKVPELVVPEEQHEGNPEEEILVGEMPKGKQIHFTSGIDDNLATYYIERFDDDVYINYTRNSTNQVTGYFVEAYQGGYRVHTKNYPSGSWQVLESFEDASTLYEAFNHLSGYIGSALSSMFNLSIIDAGSQNLGETTVNGMAAIHYELEHEHDYLSKDYKMFLKNQSKDADYWCYEVKQIVDIEAFTDSIYVSID